MDRIVVTIVRLIVTHGKSRIVYDSHVTNFLLRSLHLGFTTNLVTQTLEKDHHTRSHLIEDFRIPLGELLDLHRDAFVRGELGREINGYQVGWAVDEGNWGGGRRRTMKKQTQHGGSVN